MAFTLLDKCVSSQKGFLLAGLLFFQSRAKSLCLLRLSLSVLIALVPRTLATAGFSLPIFEVSGGPQRDGS